MNDQLSARSSGGTRGVAASAATHSSAEIRDRAACRRCSRLSLISLIGGRLTLSSWERSVVFALLDEESMILDYGRMAHGKQEADKQQGRGVRSS